MKITIIMEYSTIKDAICDLRNGEEIKITEITDNDKLDQFPAFNQYAPLHYEDIPGLKETLNVFEKCHSLGKEKAAGG